jgi:Lrp/AsnC family transcriptional regulator, leucine-responsive regulatory protein
VTSARPAPALDDVDRHIVAALCEDARRSHREVARLVGMSPGAISERVQRLERAGVLRGYHADVDLAALGIGVEAFLGVQVAQGPPVADAMATLHEVPEVVAVHLVTGRWDLLVRVRVRDHAHLRDLLVGQVWRTPSFRHSETLVVLDQRTSSPAEVLAALLADAVAEDGPSVDGTGQGHTQVGDRG